MSTLKRRESFTWFDYSRKLRGLNGTRVRRRPIKLGPALSEEEDDSDVTSADEGAPGGGEQLERRAVRRLARTYSQPEPAASCAGTSLPLPLPPRRRSDADSSDDTMDATTDAAPVVNTNRKTHSRTSSFPEVRVRSGPGCSNTLPRPHNHHHHHPPPSPTPSKMRSFDDGEADGDLDLGRRTRVNSFSEMKNAVKDKINNVRTRVRRISSHSRPTADKPPKQRPRVTSGVISEVADGVKAEGQGHGRSGVRRRVRRMSAGSSGSDAEGTPEEATPPRPPHHPYHPQDSSHHAHHNQDPSHHTHHPQDLPPQPRHRVNSFTDVKNVMKEKLKNVQARARRRGRPTSGTGSSDPATTELRRRSLSFQNLVMPSLLVRVASSPDVSQVGLTSASASGFDDDSPTMDQAEVTPQNAGSRRQSLTPSQRTASTESSDVTNGTDGSSDVTARRSMTEGELLPVTLEAGDDVISRDSPLSDVTNLPGDLIVSNNVDVEHPLNVGYHGDNDTDDEEYMCDHHGNGHSAGPYVSLTLLGRAPGGRGVTSDAGQPPGDGGPVSPPLPPDTGSARITGPQPVNDTMNQELQNQKVAFTRMMYEKATNQFENLKAERSLTEAEVNDQLRTIRRLGVALYDLTGIPAESHSASLGKRSPPPHLPGTPPHGAAGHHVSSPLPPLPPHHAPSSTGHTHTHASHAHIHIRRYPSGEHLHTSPDGHHYHRDSAHHHHHHHLHEGTPPTTANPTPWLPGGPRTRKSDSGPDVTYGDDVPRRDVTVTRTLSDSRKRVPHGVGHDGMETPQRTSSLPSRITESGDPPPHSQSPAKDEGPLSDSPDDFADSAHYDEGGPAIIPMMQQGSDSGLHSPNRIMGAEDFSSDEENLTREQVAASPAQAWVRPAGDHEQEEHRPFSDLNALKRKPSHLAVFLNYLISNSDPSPLLFYQVTEDYSKGSPKEMKKWVYEIHSTFLVPKAPLRVNVDESIITNIDNTLAKMSDKVDKLDALQSVFYRARHHAQKEISELLADLRSKCDLGLGSLYGTHEISMKGTMERSKELQLVEKYLVPHFERLLQKEEDSDRNQAMAYALATVLKQIGCQLSGKSGVSLDRCPSFVSKDTKMFSRLKTKKRQINVRDHSFAPNAYYMTTLCQYCSGIIWGIGNQGYQCTVCDTVVHKQCVELVKESCSAGHKDRKKTKRTSSIMNIIRKPSVVTQPQIPSKESRLSDDGYTSPGSSSTFRLHNKEDDNDESVLAALRQHAERDATASCPSSPVTIRRSPLLPRARKASWESGKVSPSATTFYVAPPSTSDPAKSPTFRDPILDRLHQTRPVSQIIEQYSPRVADDTRSPSSPPRPRSPETLPDTEADQRKHVVRSESLKGKQEVKSKTVRRSQSDLHVDDPNVKTVLNQSGSDTSIAGSLESPSNSSELLHDRGDSSWSKAVPEERYDDSDLDVENDLPALSASIPPENIKKLKPREKKRQEIINELLHTEKTHVRTLKVMHTVFYVNMASEAQELTRLLFPNLEQLIETHCVLNNAFKARKKENPLVSHVGDLLLHTFSGEEGEKFKTGSATFCRRQSYALEALRVRQRKDQKLVVFLQEQSLNPLCRRLELKDLIPTVMQRLTKYPLLIESLLKYTQANSVEYEQLQTSLTCSRDILSYVNETVKEFEFQQKLCDIQRRLDKKSFENSTLPMVAEYKNLDLTQYKMVYNGPLTWRIGRTKQIELHVVLLEEMLVLLQKQDEKYVLKCWTSVVSGREDSKYTHSPVLKLSNVLARNVAVDKRAFFLVCTSDIGPQIYELQAMSAEEKNKWLRYITEAVDAYKERTQKTPYKPPTAVSPDDKHSTRKESKEEPEVSDGLDRLQSSSVDSLDKVTVLQATNQTELIQPTEVVISDTVLEEAETVLSPREKLKRKDEMVRRVLEEKNCLVAEILNVPVTEYTNIAEMASDIEGEKDVRELILGASYQTSRLSQLVNDSLTAPAEEEAAEEPASPAPGSASASRDDKSAVVVSLNASSVLDITKKLSEQLSLLLGLVGDLDISHDQHALTRDVTHRSPSNSLSRHSRPNSFASITSSTSEVTETPEDVQQLASSSEETGLCPTGTSPSDIAVTTVYDVMKLEAVESDDANHNMPTTSEQPPAEVTSTEVTTTTTATILLTDANLNTAPPADETPPPAT